MGTFLDKPKTEKYNDDGGGNGLQYGLASMQGWRVEMEDAHSAIIGLPNMNEWSFFAIFDGHGGGSVSKMCSEQLLDNIVTNVELENIKVSSETDKPLFIEAMNSSIKCGFMNMDKNLRNTPELERDHNKCGSTAVCVLITSSHIFVANCGDSRAVLSSASKCALSTTDHKPENPAELERIHKAGGSVVMQRISGLLAVSRAFGDFEFKRMQGVDPFKQLVSPEPDIYVYDRDQADEFLILACDGIWDVLSNDELCDFVRNRLQISNCVKHVCNQVLDTCLYKGSGDNMTIIIVTFQGAPKLCEEAIQKEKELDEQLEQKIKEILETDGLTDVDLPYLLHALRDIQGLPPGAGLSSKLRTVEDILTKLRTSEISKTKACEFDKDTFLVDNDARESCSEFNEDDASSLSELHMDVPTCPDARVCTHPTQNEVTSENFKKDVATVDTKKKWFLQYILQIVLFTGCLYIFICSLGIIGDAFILLGGKEKGISFANSEFLANPVAGLVIGILATVVIQSSSTTTAIVISMVGSGDLITARQAIPIVMGANIGTSMTNTVVSFGQITNKNDFKRAFTGATVHDMFNWLTVIVLLPLEAVSQYLETLSKAIVDSLHIKTDKSQAYLQIITTPFTKLFIQLDMDKIAAGELKNDESIIRHTCCKQIKQMINETVNGNVTVEKLQKLNCKTCSFMFESMSRDGRYSDSFVGGILLMISIVLLISCLLCIAKIVRPLQLGYVAYIIKKFKSAKFTEQCGFCTGYMALILGAFMTIILQSSSIFTSSLTPLVGMDILSIEWMYALTLGSNIGTCVTGILAAFVQNSNKVPSALQVAFCHLFFNITGTVMWYPVPFFRPPLIAAKYLGMLVTKYRRFALLYLIFVFFLLPVVGFGLSFLNKMALQSIFIPTATLVVIVLLMKLIQRKCPMVLPVKLQNWKWLPECLRSLAPLDRLLMIVMKHFYCCMNVGICKYIATDNEDQLEEIEIH